MFDYKNRKVTTLIEEWTNPVAISQTLSKKYEIILYNQSNSSLNPKIVNYILNEIK